MIKKKIKQAYEDLADSYSQQIDHKPHNAYYDRPNTLSLFDDVKGKSILDAADGELARIKKTPSYVGRFLDSISDLVLNFLIIMAAQLYVYAIYGVPSEAIAICQ